MADEIASLSKSKKKFDVFKFFKREWLNEDFIIASCKTCQKKFPYTTAGKGSRSYITHLKQHVADGCTHVLTGDNNPSSTSRAARLQNFDYEAHPYIRDLTWMIIMGDHRLDMVELPEFLSFAKGLRSKFTVSADLIENYCLQVYLSGRETLVNILPKHISITIDICHSPRYVGHVFVTTTFIDTEWILHRCILSVIREPNPNSPNALSCAIRTCVSEWNLKDKLFFSITINRVLDNAATKDLGRMLSTDTSNFSVSHLLVRGCFSRTLTQIAQDLICLGESTVNKVRRLVAYVSTSDSRKEMFLLPMQGTQSKSNLMIVVDDRTQWNTTYNMLVGAMEMKEFFNVFTEVGLTENDWEKIKILCKFLKFLFDATDVFSTNCGAHGVAIFEKIWNILSKLYAEPEDASDALFASDLKKSLLKPLEKYLTDCMTVLGACVVIDPRFKMRMIEFSFAQIYGEESSNYVDTITDVVEQLFDEYVECPEPCTDFEVYVRENSKRQTSELQDYLYSKLVDINKPNFDIFDWWRVAGSFHPTIAKMAHKLLAISFSTISTSESIFSIKEKEMDEYQSSLHPKTVEAMICCKDWKGSNIL